MIDNSQSTPSFTVVLQDTKSAEWGWQLAGSNCRLVNGGTVAYRNHRMNITSADINTYIINTSPSDTIIPELGLDRLGYTTTGWNMVTSSGGTETMTATTATGPFGYLANEITLVSSGSAQALVSNVTSLTTIKADPNVIKVRPGELFWLSCQMQIVSGTNGYLIGNFYTTSGTLIGATVVADISSISPSGAVAWTLVEGPLLAPATAAYMVVGCQANIATVLFTDIRVHRAG
jgi:hypothetical protein